MTVRFVDTNILLYAISTAPADSAGAVTARDVVLSEDLNHVQDYDGVTVLDPFT